MVDGRIIDLHFQWYQLPKNLVEMTRGCLYADDIENGFSAKSCKKVCIKIATVGRRQRLQMVQYCASAHLGFSAAAAVTVFTLVVTHVVLD